MRGSGLGDKCVTCGTASYSFPKGSAPIRAQATRAHVRTGTLPPEAGVLRALGSGWLAAMSVLDPGASAWFGSHEPQPRPTNHSSHTKWAESGSMHVPCLCDLSSKDFSTPHLPWIAVGVRGQAGQCLQDSGVLRAVGKPSRVFSAHLGQLFSDSEGYEGSGP